MRLSANFRLAQATASKTAKDKGISNVPDAKAMTNLRYTAAVLEQFHWLIGTITSWYRSPELNAAVGGVPTSFHTTGLAVDFRPADEFDKFEVVDILKGLRIPTIRKVIVYDDTGHVHISIHPIQDKVSGTAFYVKRNGKYLEI